MLNLGEIIAVLSLDSGGFNKGISSAKEAIASMGTALLGLTAAASAAGGMAVKLASDVHETQSLAANVFGAAGAADIEKWAASSADAMGRTTQQMRQFATGIGALLTPSLGVTEQTSRMSKGMAQLSVDIASAYNIADQDALTKLKAGLMGEMEPLKALGINMSQVALQQFALSQGIKQHVDKMTEAQKQVLRYNFILQQTKIAHNDATETAAGFANQTKAIESGVTELATRVGGVLLPAAQKTADAILQLINYFRGLSDATLKSGVDFAVHATKMAGIAGVAFLLASKLIALGEALQGISLAKVLGGAGGLFSAMGAVLALSGAIAGIVAAVLVLRAAWSDVGSTMKDSLGAAFTWIKEAFSSAIQAIADAPLKVIATLIEAFATLVEKIQGSWLAQKAGIKVDTDGLAQLRETAAMLRGEHVDVAGPLKDAGLAIKDGITDALKTSRGAMMQGMKLLVGDLGHMLGVKGDVLSAIQKKFREFMEGWEAADPAAKRAKALGSMKEFAPEQLPNMVAARGYQAQYNPHEYDFAKLITDEMSRGIKDGLASVGWERLFLSAGEKAMNAAPLLLDTGVDAAGSLVQGIAKMFAGPGSQAVASGASKLVEGAASLAGAAAGEIGALGSSVIGMISNVGSAAVSTIANAIVSAVRFAVDLASKVVSSTAGTVADALTTDDRLKGAIGAAAAAFLPLITIVGMVALAFLAVATSPLALLVAPLVLLVMVIGGLVTVIGALTAAAVAGAMGIFFLATKSESYGRFATVMKVAVDTLIQATEPLFRNLMPVAGLAVLLARSLSSVIGAVIPGERLFRGLFSVVHGLAMAFANVVVLFTELRVGLIELAIALTSPGHAATFFAAGLILALETIKNKIMHLIEQMLPGEQWDSDTFKDADRALEDAKTAFNTAHDDMLSGASPALKQLLTDATAARAAALNSRQDIVDATFDGMKDFGNKIADATDKVKQFSEAMTNVPSGYKVAVARFNATQNRDGTGGGPASGTPYGNDSHGSVRNPYSLNVEYMVVVADNPDQMHHQLMRKADRINYVQTGSTVRPGGPWQGP